MIHNVLFSKLFAHDQNRSIFLLRLSIEIGMRKITTDMNSTQHVCKCKSLCPSLPFRVTNWLEDNLTDADTTI